MSVDPSSKDQEADAGATTVTAAVVGGGAANYRWLLLTAAVIGLDQWTKHLVAQHLALFDVIRILPVFNLTHLQNSGAAFSFLDGASGWQRWLFTAVALIISVLLLVWLRQINRHKPWLAAGITLVLGGAIGNVIDRLRLGHVVDFIQVHWDAHYFPSFNVADSAVTVGAVFLILDTWLESRRPVPTAHAGEQ